jgi:N-acetyl-anhydromuramyl-L-alanine amidase AmpD
MFFGNAYECGVMDSRYGHGRAVNPHYLIPPEDEMVQMTAAEITAYTAGFDNNEHFGDKIYVTEHDEDEEQVEEVEMKIDTSFRFELEIRQDLLGSL